MNRTDQIVIRESKYSQQLDEDGYTVLPSFLSPALMQELNQFFNETLPESQVQSDFFTTHWSPETGYRQKVNSLIQQRCLPLADRFFNNYKCIFGYFLYKKPASASGVGIHQDWSLIDEEKYRGFILWIPLTDTTLENGCFHLIPGSHKVYKNIRGSHIPQNLDNLSFNDFTPVALKAGDALVLDLRLMHSSPPNLTNYGRLATGMVIVPKQAQLLHYYYNNSTGKLELYKVKDTFLVDSFYDYQHRLKEDYILDFIDRNVDSTF
jgi:hypothetical protein